MTDFITKAHKAAIRFINQRGYEILETDIGSVDIIALDDDVVVFIVVNPCKKDDDFTKPTTLSDKSRAEIEKVAIEFLTKNDDIHNCSVRFDVISIKMFGDNRALIKHHIHAS